MFTASVFDGITLLSLFVCGLLAVFFAFTRTGRRFDNALLASLLAVFASQVFYSYAVSNYAFERFLAWHKELLLLKQFSLLMGPLMYLYLRSLTFHDVFPAPRLLLHGLPFAGALGFYAVVLPGIRTLVIWSSPYDLFGTILILTQSLLYIGLALGRLGSLEGGITSFVQSFRKASHATWMRFLLLGFVSLWFVKLNSFATYAILQRPGWCAYTGSIFSLIAFLGMVAMVLALLLKPDIYYVLAKYRSSPLGDGAKRSLLQLLEAHMQVRKPYLNPNLTLRTVARELGLRPRALSQVINEEHGKSFRGYLAEYRIRESMRLFAEPGSDGRTVLEILYLVGFNSKSVFNTQFKKHTGLTPVEYRARLRLGRPASPSSDDGGADAGSFSAEV